MTDSVQGAREQLAELAEGAEIEAGAVRLERDDRVARIVIDNPAARSAFTLPMMVQLADAVLALQTWDGSLVVLSSTDRRSFCSGGHLGQLVRSLDQREKARAMAIAMTAVLDGLGALPAVSVAALDGLAVGGGAELLTSADFRVASPESRIHFVHTRLGIAPGWGGTRRLTRLVGRRAALRILTTARPLFPGQAAEIGLVDHRCEGLAEAGALEWLADLREREPLVIQAVKRQVQAAERDGDEARAIDADAFADVWGGPAHQTALVHLERHHKSDIPR